MKKFFTALTFALLLGGGLYAQVFLPDAIVLNGGIFSDPTTNVAVTSYRPGGGFTFIDSIGTASVQEAVFDETSFYVLAQDSIVKYSRATYQRQAAARFPGVSTVTAAFYDSLLLVGNWFGQPDSNLYVFDAATLTVLDTVGNILTGAKSIAVVGDTAYVVQNLTSSAFADSAGYLAVVDLTTREWVRNVTFPEITESTQEAIGKLYARGDTLYAVNGQRNTIIRYDVTTGAHTYDSLGFSVRTPSYGAVPQQVGDTLYALLQPAGTTTSGIGAFRLSDGVLFQPPVVDTNITSFAYSLLLDQYYVTHVDFLNATSSGYVFDGSGNFEEDMTVGITPEVVRMNEILAVSLASPNAAPTALALYPNPADGWVALRTDGRGTLTLYDLRGQVVGKHAVPTANARVSVADLPAGLYLARWTDGQQTRQTRFVKQ